MRISNLLFGLTALCAFIPNLHAEVVQQELVDIVPDVFTPMGFDNNDTVEIVIDGSLPNYCYRIGPTTINVDKEKHTITVRQQAYHRTSSSWCAAARLPYTLPVRLGMLPPGNYQVLVDAKELNHPRVAGMLPIASIESNGPDERLYAPVTDVRVRKIVTGENPEESHPVTPKHPYEAVLTGVLTSSCMTLDHTEVLVRENHVIEVLPIVKMAGEGCADVVTPFTVRVPLAVEAKSGRQLVHVRAAGGNAIHQVSDF
jgi:hypothetical protein